MKRGFTYYILLFAILLSSCSSEIIKPSEKPSFEKKDSIDAQFVITENSPPSTYALDDDKEEELGSMDVLLFKLTGGGEVFSERIAVDHASILDNGAGGKKFRISLKKTPDKFRFVLIANASTSVTQAIRLHPGGGLKEDLLADIISEVDANDPRWNTSDTNYRPIPMWGESDDMYAIDDNLPENLQIGLLRSLARIDVLIKRPQVTPDKFKLHSIYVYNTKKKGRVVPAYDVPGLLQTNPIDYRVLAPSLPLNITGLINPLPLEYIIPSPATLYFNTDSCSGEIYIYESNSLPVGYDLDVTCLVIGGYYENATELSYYRVDFAQKEAGKIKAYMDILRNHNYRFYIASVLNAGDKTPKEAFERRRAGMVVEIVTWTEGSLNSIDISQYHLSIAPQSSFNIASGTYEGMVIITTDHSSGWTAAVRSGDAAMVSITEKTENQLRFKVTANPTPGNSRKGIINVTAGEGKVTKQIIVIQN